MENPAQWRVLVVDDEIDNLGLFQLVLNHHNAGYKCVQSGIEALLILDTYPANIMLIDIQMPEMTGYQLLSMIRSKPTFAKSVMIAVTAYAMQEDERRVLEVGFDGYIPKPINVMEFVNDIKKILKKRGLI